MSTPLPQTTPGVPYDPATLHPPLREKRPVIIAWLLAHPSDQQYSALQLRGMSDATLIQTYTGVVVTQHALEHVGGTVLGSITSVVDFLRELASFIFDPVRMGELVAGIILVGVGVNALTRGKSGQVVSAPARVAVRVTTAPAKASRAASEYASETTRQASRDYARSYAREAGRKAAKT